VRQMHPGTGRLQTAVDGTVLDLAAADPVKARFATPAGGRFPQARVVTLVACGTRRVLAAVFDSCALKRTEAVGPAGRPAGAGHAEPGGPELLLDGPVADRGRDRGAPGVAGEERDTVPARHRAAYLPDGSELIRLRESDAMLSARRKATGCKKAPRLEDILARLVSVELAYKTIKTTLRGGNRRLRGQSPDLAEQETCGTAGRLQRPHRPGRYRRRRPRCRPR
jgi:hypothetical protein